MNLVVEGGRQRAHTGFASLLLNILKNLLHSCLPYKELSSDTLNCELHIAGCHPTGRRQHTDLVLYRTSIICTQQSNRSRGNAVRMRSSSLSRQRAGQVLQQVSEFFLFVVGWRHVYLIKFIKADAKEQVHWYTGESRLYIEWKLGIELIVVHSCPIMRGPHVITAWHRLRACRGRGSSAQVSSYIA